jgi:hypothetical protein
MRPAKLRRQPQLARKSMPIPGAGSCLTGHARGAQAVVDFLGEIRDTIDFLDELCQRELQFEVDRVIGKDPLQQLHRKKVSLPFMPTDTLLASR